MKRTNGGTLAAHADVHPGRSATTLRRGGRGGGGGCGGGGGPASQVRALPGPANLRPCRTDAAGEPDGELSWRACVD